MIISKTIFLDYIFCPRNTWLKLHKPELLEKFELSAFEQNLMEQGNEVEKEARKLFPNGVEVLERGEEAVEKTKELMEERTPAIFQATFVEDGFIARNDVLVWNAEESSWDLYEIKGTNSLKEGGTDHNHIDDLTFQASVMSRADVPIGRYFLVHLNKDYVRFGALNIDELFLIEDQTENVLANLPIIEEQMKTAKDYLNNKKEPPRDDCKCLYKGRSSHCTTFRYSFEGVVPHYSVHDISRIGASKKKLASLVEDKIFEIGDVPEDMELSDIQTNQIAVHRSQKSMIDTEGISEEIKNLVFPLYFFDYETYAPALPAFDGYRPYQRIPFQFSLHILEKPGEKMAHIEYLHEEMSDPSENVARLLDEHIGAVGTVIAWNKSFEAGVNRELGERIPEHKATMERVNNMLYDLMDVFKKQHFVHPEFRGSTSIKKVLPALVPELSYKDLGIKEGGQASNSWWEMLALNTPPERSAEISKDLKIYCGLDTYAMYAIWDRLYKMLD